MEPFVPEWMKGSLFKDFVYKTSDLRKIGRRSFYNLVSQVSDLAKEAEMKANIRINYVFWKEGPLLPLLLAFLK
jgi:hypothetical protein